MEPNFQTSFIPKKPMIEQRATATRPVGLLTVLAIIVLFVLLIATGGLFFYKGILAKSITDMQNSLNLAQNRFEPSKITQLQTLDKRLNAATVILSKHVAVTPIFQAISAITMKTVSYTNFSYTIGTASAGNSQNPMINVKMSGVAVGYRSIALQSDLLSTNKNIIDPVFSNLNLDNKGNVTFDLQFSVDPSFVNYKQNLLTQS